jgi:hypothetical protein
MTSWLEIRSSFRKVSAYRNLFDNLAGKNSVTMRFLNGVGPVDSNARNVGILVTAKYLPEVYINATGAIARHP